MELETLDYEIEPKFNPRKELGNYQKEQLEDILSNYTNAASEEYPNHCIEANIITGTENLIHDLENDFDSLNEDYELSVVDKEDDPEIYAIQKELFINKLR